MLHKDAMYITFEILCPGIIFLMV
jgi:hypothetical protein